MSYVIFGRAVKSEHLALATLFTTAAGGWLASGGKKEAKPAPGQSKLDQVKESVPINAGSTEEEQFIKKYVAEAEKEGKH